MKLNFKRMFVVLTAICGSFLLIELSSLWYEFILTHLGHTKTGFLAYAALYWIPAIIYLSIDRTSDGKE